MTLTNVERLIQAEGRTAANGQCWRLLPTLVWDGRCWLPRSMNFEAAAWPVGANVRELPVPRFSVGSVVRKRRWVLTSFADGSEVYVPLVDSDPPFLVQEITLPGGWFQTGPAALIRAMHEFWLTYGIRYLLERPSRPWVDSNVSQEWTMTVWDREGAVDADLIAEDES